MRNFLFRTLGFVMVGMLIPIVILLLPIDRKYQYAFVKNACTLKSNYIYHRIYEDSLPIDVVFLGSSHTMCGINDSIVQSGLSAHGLKMEVSNMGFCRLGRDIEYMIFKDILSRKKPKILVLEVRQEEPELGHPDFGYMAPISDIMSAPLFINRSFAGDLSSAFSVRLNYLRDVVCGKVYDSPYEAPQLGFMQQNIVADTSVLYNGARFRWERYYRHTRPVWADEMMTSYPKNYVKNIMALAKENNVRVIMLYIPNFGYPYHQPKELSYYKQVTDVMMMSNSFYDNEKNWMEDEHLNKNASIILSDSVAQYISSHLSQ